VRLQPALPGEYWKWQDAQVTRYYVLTDGATFTVAPAPGTVLSEDEALKVLSGFVS
jgi:hypothetical protein